MITVTATAGTIITNTLEANRQADDDVFRLVVVGNDLSLSVDAERDGDIVVRHETRAILVIEPPVAEAIGDVTIDTDADDPSRLVLKTGDNAAAAPQADHSASA